MIFLTMLLAADVTELKQMFPLWSEEEISDLKLRFQMLDLNSDGLLDEREMLEILKLKRTDTGIMWCVFLVILCLTISATHRVLKRDENISLNATPTVRTELTSSNFFRCFPPSSGFE